MPEAAEGREVRALFGLAEVEGPSMVPTLYQGDQVLIRYGARVRPGHVVILRHPLQQNLLIVKRAVQRRRGGWWVLADNPGAGADSTVYGVVPDELIMGRVLGRYRPRARDRGQRPLAGTVGWLLSAVRPVLSARPARLASWRLRAR
ncbi:nickel-type superoxide dismutase maturation protease [Streptomyces sp. TS71-3]|uniref:nickel-type superoxide dismutase maturation protease n=1 Tax=Streptomyces sp. TS71-3 TaxID=2733862 RepID=UPI001B1EFBEF|nr:nickel-type superoxide dismutase maturation protease [Streptomyces sp. TS71-3]GHJ35902.1 S26 family signal peptidase [Streptomyces sp. TS71-3]